MKKPKTATTPALSKLMADNATNWKALDRELLGTIIAKTENNLALVVDERALLLDILAALTNGYDARALLGIKKKLGRPQSRTEYQKWIGMHYAALRHHDPAKTAGDHMEEVMRTWSVDQPEVNKYWNAHRERIELHMRKLSLADVRKEAAWRAREYKRLRGKAAN